MKYFLLLIGLSICSLANAQQKKHTIFYLIDTAHSAKSLNLWQSYKDQEIKGLEFNCSCYPNQTNALFVYRGDRKPILLSKENFQKMKLIDLTSLLKMAAQFGANKRPSFQLFIVEPAGENFEIREGRFQPYFPLKKGRDFY